MQSLQDKKKNLKDAGDCQEELRTLHEENEERHEQERKEEEVERRSPMDGGTHIVK